MPTRDERAKNQQTLDITESFPADCLDNVMADIQANEELAGNTDINPAYDPQKPAKMYTISCMTSEPDRSKITQKLFPVGTLKRVNSSIPEIIGDKYTFVPVVDSPAADKLREIMRRYTKR